MTKFINMNKKKLHIWKLATFLCENECIMSHKELAYHLNRNEFTTNDGQEYAGKRGTFKLIEVTYKWLDEHLKLPEEAKKVARAFTNLDNEYPYE